MVIKILLACLAMPRAHARVTGLLWLRFQEQSSYNYSGERAHPETRYPEREFESRLSMLTISDVRMLGLHRLTYITLSSSLTARDTGKFAAQVERTNYHPPPTRILYKEKFN